MYQRQSTFSEAVSSAISTNYCNFSGRASRADYWWFFLFNFILGICISIFTYAVSQTGGQVISYIVSLLLLLPGLGLSFRRLHDTGRSGWWLLIGLIPLVGEIILIVWMCQPSEPTPNRFGAVPHLEA